MGIEFTLPIEVGYLGRNGTGIATGLSLTTLEKTIVLSPVNSKGTDGKMFVEIPYNKIKDLVKGVSGVLDTGRAVIDYGQVITGGFQGRNVIGHVSGVVVDLSIDKERVWITPLTSKGELARAYLTIPVAQLSELSKLLELSVNRKVMGLLGVEV